MAVKAKGKRPQESQPVPDLSRYQDLAVERAVLGGIMRHRDFRVLLGKIDESYFAIDPHKLIFATCRQLMEQGIAPDILAVSDRLRERSELDRVGGLSYLMDLDESSRGESSEVLAEAYRAILAKHRARRQIYEAVLKVETELATADPSDLASWLVSRMAELGTANGSANGARKRIEQVIDQAGGVDRIMNPPTDGIILPWPSVELRTGRIRPSSYWIIAGRPGSGKTTAAIQIAVEAAMHDFTVVFVSLEMPIAELVLKAVCALAGFNPRQHQDDVARRLEAVSALTRLSGKNLEFMDSSFADPSRILAEVERMETKPDLVVIDYIQLMHLPRSRASRNEELATISSMLKIMAARYGTAILALSQLSRYAERDNREPGLHDLRDSGALEADADTVILLAPNKRERDPKTVRWIVAKNRYGSTGYIPMELHGSRSVFIEEAK